MVHVRHHRIGCHPPQCIFEARCIVTDTDLVPGTPRVVRIEQGVVLVRQQNPHCPSSPATVASVRRAGRFKLAGTLYPVLKQAAERECLDSISQRQRRGSSRLETVGLCRDGTPR